MTIQPYQMYTPFLCSGGYLHGLDDFLLESIYPIFTSTIITNVTVANGEIGWKSKILSVKRRPNFIMTNIIEA